MPMPDNYLDPIDEWGKPLLELLRERKQATRGEIGKLLVDGTGRRPNGYDLSRIDRVIARLVAVGAIKRVARGSYGVGDPERLADATRETMQQRAIGAVDAPVIVRAPPPPDDIVMVNDVPLEGRFCLLQDDECRWFLVPALARGRFLRWAEQRRGDVADDGDIPKFARLLPKRPSEINLTFTGPMLRGVTT